MNVNSAAQGQSASRPTTTNTSEQDQTECRCNPESSDQKGQTALQFQVQHY